MECQEVLPLYTLSGARL